MLMFLTILFTSVAATAICWVLFQGAAPHGEPRPALRPDERIATGSSRFFASETPAEASAMQTPIPVELLISQIERHVRLEQAAAESFLAGPTTETLHSRTASPFVN